VRLASLLLLFMVSATVIAQNPASEPRFDVVSIKLHTGAPATSVPSQSPGALRRPNVTAHALVLFAYQIDEYQLFDTSQWTRSNRYDVEAKAEGATAVEMPAMTRSLLRERFGLRAHYETREGTTYDLAVANADRRLGPNLKPNHDDCQSRVEAPSNTPAGAIRTAGCSDADSLARFVSRMLAAPVTNKTELSGQLEYALFYSPEGITFPDKMDTIAPHFTTALQEQLGLKLDRGRGTFQVLVIDNIERPTEN
jgi:uncharacterized protein (TIGR03435 family)